ncbi:hypothetical protein LTR99_000121 [Exophiala xenobiotica]|uniref:RING-type domain-containing protein n=1 Tax=Vermiconidia calcicola TaxID=1690605 RepID=A0AAV9PXX2_9PEZI|nr:hypothetical protein LTR99_000121 [Exophiala xenobiotica]KAK5439156.1 hypothetical protein LTR34_000121 [Exophiala xenobiotica]KAK5530070.1 hypothetical protein LTR25_009315 [Vermiconidia calcicola]KAK5547390.1 hypothetical protein LTR23_002611 [Chaetothyriales sp. CCFEE 6169]KAK5553925.1 hypothetical protein LTR46_008031 [Exophiala xenobiotica]
MYIPRQQELRGSKSVLMLLPVAGIEGPEPLTFALRAAMPPTGSSTNSTSETENKPVFGGEATAFIAVSITVLIFLAAVVAWTVYRRDSHGAADSDTESSSSESVWRVEPEYASPNNKNTIAAKHRRRIKKLEQMAPSQTLSQWRADKQEHHVKTFATISTKLICAICLDGIQDADTIRELQCCHVYHATCLNLWVERGHHDCPLCKYDIIHGAQKDAQKEHGLEHAESAETSPPDHQQDGPREHPAVTASRELEVRMQQQQANVTSGTTPATNEDQTTSHGANAEERREDPAA